MVECSFTNYVAVGSNVIAATLKKMGFFDICNIKYILDIFKYSLDIPYRYPPANCETLAKSFTAYLDWLSRKIRERLLTQLLQL